MRHLVILIGLLSILIIGCNNTIDRTDNRDFKCPDAKLYCESLLSKDSEGRVLLDHGIMEDSVYNGISCESWSIKCNWYPMD